MTPAPFRVSAVLFPGFELLDLYGPLELLGMAGAMVEVSTVAESAGVVPSSQTPRGVADRSFADAPKADLLLVPGGMGTRREIDNPRMMDFLREHAAAARWVASVCTGSVLLARAGLLDGRCATSNKRVFEWVASQGPNVRWIRKARWVEDGRFFTSSGVSAGMDMTLALIEREFGAETRCAVATRAEYSWHSDAALDPFAPRDPG